MNAVFGTFCRMIDSLPVEGIYRAMDAESSMLVEDFALRRPVPLEDAFSILHFYHFLLAAAVGISISPVSVPAEHIEFYRQTVDRLINGGELPETAQERFEATFEKRGASHAG